MFAAAIDYFINFTMRRALSRTTLSYPLALSFALYILPIDIDITELLFLFVYFTKALATAVFKSALPSP